MDSSSPTQQTPSIFQDGPEVSTGFAQFYDFQEGQHSRAIPHELIASQVHEKLAQPVASGGRLIFLSGYPDFKVLHGIESFYGIDPDLFKRHIDLEVNPVQTPIDRSESTAFPLAVISTIQLEIPLTGRHVNHAKLTTEQLLEARKTAYKSMKTYVQNLRKTRGLQPGLLGV